VRLKIIIPMAGRGARLRPHTWSRPKQLLSIAGRTMLDHVLDTFGTLPDREQAEYIFVLGHRGEQIPPYMAAHHPSLRVHYVEQRELKGQSHAIFQAREHLTGPTLMVFADTLVETDFSFLAARPDQAVVWVKVHPDPQGFGVAVTGPDGKVNRFIEKPPDATHNRVVVGFYYFPSGEDLIAAIETQLSGDLRSHGEYYLADAVNLMIEAGLEMITHPVQVWLDAGTPQTVLEANRYLLEHGHAGGGEDAVQPGVAVLPPVFIHPEAEVEGSVIGPHASLGPGVRVQGSVVRNAILEEGAQVRDALIDGAILGRGARVTGRASIINLGDQGELDL
jgi:glucose-1-phosphate thymidylyltransferase